jgi:cytochrome c
MFDTMTLVKAGGAVCGALLIFLFGNWAAESIYGFGEGGHGEGAALAYSVAAEATEDHGATEAVAEPAYAELAAVADPALGEKVFGKCKACHKIDGGTGTGPHLDGVVGRPHASVEGFSYSAGMAEKKGEPWTPDALYAFLKSPKSVIPGTKMSFAGLPKPEDRANVIAYLETLN